MAPPHEKPTFRVEAALPAPAKSYFLERDSAAFRSLLSKMLKIGQLEFNDLWREGTSSYVRMITKPEFGSWVPKGVANQLSSGQLEFHDIIEYNPAYIASPPYKIFVRTESPFLKDKLDVRMTLTIEELDGGASCRQVLEGHIRVRMFGVGRIVEGIVKESLQNTYKKLPEIVRRWQLFREEALQAGDGRQLLLGRPPVGCEVGWIRKEVVQILQEPLPDDGSATPVSALCPVAGASEASNDSPAALLRAQHRPQQQQSMVAEAEEAEEMAAAREQQTAAQQQQQLQQQQQQGEVEPAGAEELLGLGRRSAGVALSGPSGTQYYDALDEPCAGAGSGLADTAASPAGTQPPASGTAEEPGEGPRHGLAALAAAVLARGAHHRRGLSASSATSTDTPTTGEEGAPGRQQPMSRRFWRRFNRDYGEWDAYWDTMGVEAEEVEGQPATRGIVSGALHAAEEMLRNSYYSTSILVALFLMRNGWLRVQPDINADPHDEHTRQHAGHRHTRTHSSSGLGDASLPDLGGSSSEADASGRPLPPARAQSLTRVAQEVQKRLVSGSRAVAKAPVRAVAKAGSSMRQASLNWGDLFARPPRPSSANGNDRSSIDGSGKAGADGSVAGPLPPRPPIAAAAQAGGSGGNAMHGGGRHRKTVSLDTGTAAEARRAATAAMEAHEQLAVGAGAGGMPAGVSPSKALQRRPSNMASLAMAASMERAEHRVHSHGGGRCRLSCFTICSRQPAVKD